MTFQKHVVPEMLKCWLIRNLFLLLHPLCMLQRFISFALDSYKFYGCVHICRACADLYPCQIWCFDVCFLDILFSKLTDVFLGVWLGSRMGVALGESPHDRYHLEGWRQSCFPFHVYEPIGLLQPIVTQFVEDAKHMWSDLGRAAQRWAMHYIGFMLVPESLWSA